MTTHSLHVCRVDAAERDVADFAVLSVTRVAEAVVAVDETRRVTVHQREHRDVTLLPSHDLQRVRKR